MRAGIFASAANPSGEVIDPSIAWHLDASKSASWPGSGTLWKDLSPNSWDMTLEGGVYSSLAGGCFQQSAAGYLGRTASSISTTVFSSAAYTASVWVNPSSNREGALIGFADLTWMMWWSPVEKLHTPQLYWGSSPRLAGTALTPGVWSHVAFTNNANALKAYLNGVEVATATAYNPMTTTSGRLGFGNYRSTDGFEGYANDIRLYSKELSAAEVGGVFSATKTKYGVS